MHANAEECAGLSRNSTAVQPGILDPVHVDGQPQVLDERLDAENQLCIVVGMG